MLLLLLFAAIPPALSSGVPVDQSDAVRRVMTCYEEKPSPDAARKIEVFLDKTSVHVELVYNNIAGEKTLIESIECRTTHPAPDRTRTFLNCSSEETEILITDAKESSKPYAYLSSIDEDGVVSNEHDRFVCEAH